MFQRFTVVMEYEQKPILPPPFIIFCHIFLLFKYLKRKMEGVEESYDNGLKLFLDRDEMERLYDFEEDCVEGYFAEQENKLLQSTEERIKITTERIEHLTQKVEDIHTKENMQTTVLQNLEVRCRKFTEQLQEMAKELEDMRQQFQKPLGIIVPSNSGHEGLRERSISEQTEAPSEDESVIHQLMLQPNKRKPIVRSLTEVRPDAYIFDNGQHIEYRYDEDDEGCEREQLDNISISGSKQHLNFVRQRTKSTDSKTSNDSGDVSVDDVAGLSLDILRNRTIQRRRDSTGNTRRGSESGGNACELRAPFLTPKSISLCVIRKLAEDSSSLTNRATLSKRQFSQTQSEPETSDPPPTVNIPPSTVSLERSVTFTEPKIKVIPPITATGSSRAGLLMHMHSEYTSITDELESVCGLLSPPRSPGLLSPPRPEQSPPTGRKRNHSDMSNPEIAINFEKEHLRSAEECDYMVMENLIQRRYEDEDDEDQNGQPNLALLSVVTETREYRVNAWPIRNTLQRSSAVESDMPSVQGALLDSNSSSTDRQDSTESSDIQSAITQPPLQRPSIVIDSSQLPIHQEVLSKADSKASLHMQSETMC